MGGLTQVAGEHTCHTGTSVIIVPPKAYANNMQVTGTAVCDNGAIPCLIAIRRILVTILEQAYYCVIIQGFPILTKEE